VLHEGTIMQARIGAGGVAATPVRARETEALLLGKVWNRATLDASKRSLQGHFQPIDDMRASAAYRTTVLANLFERYWLDSQAAMHQGAAQHDAQATDLSHGWAA
jgi:xanthine dehydrogenase small subunit